MTEKTTERTNSNGALGRRDVLRAAVGGALAVAGSGFVLRGASATPETAAQALAKMAGSGKAMQGKVTLKLPEIAENGRTVPLSVSVDSPMSDKDYVKAIHIVAEGNPNPEVVSFNLTPAVGKAEISTRMRLGKTQNVVAAAVMNDGSVYKVSRLIKVTIGGCGG